jgi:hypothetical protein
MAAPLKYANYLTKKLLRTTYDEFKCVEKMGKHLGIDKNTIIAYMDRHEIKRAKVGTNPKPRKCTNDTLFSTDTETSMYLAGFIAADGCLYRGRAISIGLSDKDLSHLKLLKKLFKSTNKLSQSTNRAGKPMSCLKVGSKQMHDDLIGRFNVTPRKTFTLKFPKRLIDHSLVNHFIRGFLDGDGSFYKNAKYDTLRLSFIGTKDMLNSIAKVFANECTITSKHKAVRGSKKNCKTFDLKYGDQSELDRIVHWLYDDATIYLKRKRNIALTVAPAEHRGIGGRAVKLSNDDVFVIRALKGKKPVKDIAKQFDIDQRYVRRILAGEARAVLV